MTESQKRYYHERIEWHLARGKQFWRAELEARREAEAAIPSTGSVACQR